MTADAESVAVIHVGRILTAAATGKPPDQMMYDALLRELIADDQLKPLLPPFVRTYRSLGEFCPFIKDAAGTYAERRQIISEAFTPVVNFLEGQGRDPSDELTSNALVIFDAEGV